MEKLLFFLMNVQLLLARTLGSIAGEGKTKKTFHILPALLNRDKSPLWFGERLLMEAKEHSNGSEGILTPKSTVPHFMRSCFLCYRVHILTITTPLYRIMPLVHTLAETRAWLDHNSVNTSVWPPQSPRSKFDRESMARQLRSSCGKILMGATHHQIYTSGLSVYFTPFLRTQSSIYTPPFHGG